MNRAFDGDVVAVELLPQSLLPGSQAVKIADRDDEEEEEEPVGLVPASADDAPRESQVQENSQLTGSNRPCGRVIGIIKRNWRQ
jgi:exosome complex exonuclease DIS3/RRP44